LESWIVKYIAGHCKVGSSVNSPAMLWDAGRSRPHFVGARVGRRVVPTTSGNTMIPFPGGVAAQKMGEWEISLQRRHTGCPVYRSFLGH